MPYSVPPKIDTELDLLEQLGLLRDTAYSGWDASIVAVKKKSGVVSVCGDFSTGLNNAIQMHQYRLPVPEGLFAKLNERKVFCKQRLNHCTKGYRYNKLPFNSIVKVTQSDLIMQQVMP